MTSVAPAALVRPKSIRADTQDGDRRRLSAVSADPMEKALFGKLQDKDITGSLTVMLSDSTDTLEVYQDARDDLPAAPLTAPRSIPLGNAPTVRLGKSDIRLVAADLPPSPPGPPSPDGATSAASKDNILTPSQSAGSSLSSVERMRSDEEEHIAAETGPQNELQEPQTLIESPTNLINDTQNSNYLIIPTTNINNIGPNSAKSESHPAGPVIVSRGMNRSHTFSTPSPAATEIERMRLLLKESIIAKREQKRRRREVLEDEKVLVGNKVSEGHENYVMAYDMLTGIRFSVSRCTGKPDRPLVDADFTASHKFAFDVTGKELTPSAKYDFKFKDYAPWVFRHLRNLFRLDPGDYLVSLTAKYIVSELGSPGKSGSFFYFSRDYRFIIKTIRHSEHRLLRKILREYYQHVKTNPNTLISQFYGLHRVKLPFGRKIHFIVMNNLFPPHRDIHITYDLKGSLWGRYTDVEKAKKEGKTSIIRKDLNWLQDKQQICLGPAKSAQFLAQLTKDVELLSRLRIMDYSLLLGIHDMERGNKEKIRDQTLKVFEPDGETGAAEVSATEAVSETERKKSVHQIPHHPKLIRRKTFSQNDPPHTEGAILRDKIASVVPATLQNDLPEEDFPDRSEFVFYADHGGFQATDAHDEPLNEIYYLGIIDCLTPYTFVKRLETFWRTLSHSREEVSAVPPAEYGARFFAFMKKATQKAKHD